ncbi:two-component system response regulator KdpE [Azohydromonas lata]|uniref:Two-component system response regulator KdpE n=1 Tax=Azohydromonas lata TaxID=45677 RepID=A0ABU5IQK0_9BURK|nr:two-component system response regulator KdpE [Azohydromonas lata]MDZ5461166.1 two-component system response regulator KdpE [Azohydromonas lata]
MSEPTPRILIVEDEAEIRRFVGLALEREGFDAYQADTLQRGLIEAATRRPDMVVLDLGLPDGDGVDLIRQLRGWSGVPVLVLSARTDEADKVQALDAGADDYLIKPFGVGELLARVRAHLRRRAAAPRDAGTTVEFGNVSIDLARRVVQRAGESLHLTPIEYRLLTHLAAHPHCVLTHRQLLQAVWGPSHARDTHYLRVFMGQLRKKVEQDPAQPRHLLTETGIGYRFTP